MTKLNLENVYIYPIIAFSFENLEKDNNENNSSSKKILDSLKKHKNIYCVEEYDSNNDFFLHFKDREVEKWDIQRRKQTGFIPSTIENYCFMDLDRLSSVYRQINKFIRCQIDDVILQEQFKDTFAHEDFLGKHELCSLVMTLFSTGVGLLTFRIELEKPSKKILSQAMRKINLYRIDSKVQKFLNSFQDILPRKSQQRHSAEEVFDQIKCQVEFLGIFACESGRQKIYRGERIGGFSYAFLSTGVKGVVILTNTIHTEDAELFFEKMYNKIDKSSISYYQAFLEIKRELKENKSECWQYLIYYGQAFKKVSYQYYFKWPYIILLLVLLLIFSDCLQYKRKQKDPCLRQKTLPI